jgi:hypothetical protein
MEFVKSADKPSQGFDNLYGANGFMNYPAFPMQYPMSGDGIAPLGLIPVELDIEGLYEDHDRRRRKGGSDKVVSSHVHSVCNPNSVTQHMTDILCSAAGPRTAPRNGLSGTGKRNI